MRQPTPPDGLHRILAELADPVDPAQQRDLLQWCLRTLIMPAERRAALEARLRALDGERPRSGVAGRTEPLLT